MKNMRNLMVFGLLILASIQAFGQQSIMGYNFGYTVDELVKGNEILAFNELKSTCITYTETPYGIFVGTRTPENVPVNYLYKENKLTHAYALDRYTIFGYLKNSNSLVITSYNSKSSDVISDKLFTYNLKLQLKEQIVDHTQGDIYNIAVNGDTIVCLINVKRLGQVGSDVKPKLIVLN